MIKDINPPSGMAEALLGLVAKYANNPSLDLRDDNQQNAIHLGSSSTQNLNLVINNLSSSEDVQINPIANASTPSSTNYHFKISFISKNITLSLLTSAPAPNWLMSLVSGGDTTTIYFLATQAQTISAGDNLTLKISYSNAQAPLILLGADIGANTSYITNLPSHSRAVSLTLVPPGKEKIPLIVDILGRRTLLNDGSPQDLTFYLQNLDPDGALSLTPSTESNPSTFTLWFDTITLNTTGGFYPEYLGISSDIQSIKIAPPPGWSCKLSTPSGQGNPQWTITTTDTTIGSLGSLAFSITNIITEMDPGFTNLYLKYQNIPGYEDGIMTAQIEKSPTQYQANAGDGSVSLGPYAINPSENTTTEYDFEVNNAAQGINLNFEKTGGGQLQLTSGAQANSIYIFASDSTGQKSATLVQILSPTNAETDVSPITQIDLAASSVTASKGRIKDKTGFVMPVGSVIAYCAETPQGWLLCDGRGLDINENSDYGELAEKLGDTYGVDENGNFRVPNLRGNTIFGQGGSVPGNLGHWAGKTSTNIKLEETNLPSHTHSISTNVTNTLKYTGESSNFYFSTTKNGESAFFVEETGASGAGMHVIDTNISTTGSLTATSTAGNTGSGESITVPTMPPYMILNYIIKY